MSYAQGTLLFPRAPLAWKGESGRTTKLGMGQSVWVVSTRLEQERTGNVRVARSGRNAGHAVTISLAQAEEFFTGETRPNPAPEMQGQPTVSGGKLRLIKRLAKVRPGYEFIVQGHYGSHGWEDLTAHDNRLDAINERKVYDANESYPHRVIARRVVRQNPPEKIFGYDWNDIQRMQQKNYSPGTVGRKSPAERKAEIERDIIRFKIPVAKSVVEGYQIQLPAGYVLLNDTFEFRP